MRLTITPLPDSTAAQTWACLKKQPDATESDCKKWEKDGQLGDDGTHQGHKG